MAGPAVRRKKPLPRDQLFNPLARKVLRKQISAREAAFGALFVAALIGAGLWIAAQKDNFDPAERDIGYQALVDSSVEDTLYRVPLQRWREPGTQGGPEAPAADLGVFPPELLAEGWQLDGRVESYDPSDVYEKINGAAEQYLRFGFKRLHYVTLARGQDLLTIELYDQGSFQNALGVYSEQKDPGQAVERRGDLELYTTPAGVIGRYDRYYFKIAGNSGNEAVLAKASAVADALAQLPTAASDEPLPLRVLARRLGIAPDALEYAKTDAFQYDFASDFWFGRFPDSADTRYFVHEAADPEAARQLFGRLLEEQKNEYSSVAENEQGALLEHEFLKTVFGIRVRGAIVYGVDGAAGREAAEAALGRLEEGLSRESKADPAP
jgi:hypothetical protein